ncbi:MAG: hypothetical protein WDW38_005735 [Sanguina aurantia]
MGYTAPDDDDEYEELAEDAEEGGETYLKEAIKENTIFLVDASRKMFDKPQDGGKSYFSYALRWIVGVLQRKIQRSPDDKVAILFYNTVGKGNTEYQGLHMMMKLGGIDAQCIKSLRNFTDERFISEIGSRTPSSETVIRAVKICRDVLKAVHNPTQIRPDQNIVVFSNEECPAETTAARYLGFLIPPWASGGSGGASASTSSTPAIDSFSTGTEHAELDADEDMRMLSRNQQTGAAFEEW